MHGCAEKPDFTLSLVYSRKKCLLKIENSHKKSAGEKRAQKSVSSFSYGRNYLFLTFMARRRMPPLDFTSFENFVFVVKIGLLSHVWEASSQKLEGSFKKPIDVQSKTSTCLRN
jgi:hypothetical protein